MNNKEPEKLYIPLMEYLLAFARVEGWEGKGAQKMVKTMADLCNPPSSSRQIKEIVIETSEPGKRGGGGGTIGLHQEG